MTPNHEAVHAVMSSTGYPLVSVIVPAHNEQAFLDDCIRSIVSQSLMSIECIVVDDASSDATLDIAADWATRDRRVVVVRHDVNRGLAGSRNSGLQLARGRFVTFLDADDFLFASSLADRSAHLLEATEASSEVVGVYCDWMPVPEAALLDEQVRPPVDKPDVDYLSCCAEIPFIATAPLLVREPLVNLGGFDESYRSSEDYEFWMRVMRHGYRLLYTKTVGVAYRQRRAGMVQARPAEHAHLAVQVLNAQNEPLPATQQSAGTPTLFAAPLHEYEQRVRLVKRLMGPLALAVAKSDDQQIQSILEMFPIDAAGASSYALDLEALAQSSLNRVRRADNSMRGVDVETMAARCAELARTHLAQTSGSGRVLGAMSDESFRNRPAPLSIVEPSIVELTDPEHRGNFGGVVMVPMARYHVEEMVPLARELNDCGRQVSWMLTRFFPEAIRMEMRRHDIDVLFQWPDDIDAIPRFDAAVMLNDWGPSAELVELADRRGIPTFAKVEGVQDFEDADTGRVRRPYHNASHVLCQGSNDVAALAGRPLSLVGSSRLEKMSTGPERTFRRSRPLVVINSNFTYNVLTAARDAWVGSVVGACREMGVEPLVSQHHADGELPSHIPVSDRSMADLLREADVLVSRFSTVPFEAMALGVPFVYHNPHGERVPLFLEPDGAFPVSHDPASLREAIAEALALRGSYREHSRSFFAKQVDIDESRSSSERAAEIIGAVLGSDDRRPPQPTQGDDG